MRTSLPARIRTTGNVQPKGYDASWSPEKKDFKTRYANLPALFFPREYRFDVIAANSNGIWMESPMSYVFSVHPPWWFQWWAFSVYTVALAVVVAAFVRFHRSRLIRNEREKASRREAQLELEAALAKFATAEAEAKALYQNTSKISTHGARADGIVRSMLSHSGGYSGRRELVNVNDLTDDVLNVALNSLNESEPNMVVARDYDENVGAFSVVTQEFSRVLANLISNAVYAAAEHHRMSDTRPCVTVSTRGTSDTVSITVSDNGIDVCTAR